MKGMPILQASKNEIKTYKFKILFKKRHNFLLKG